MQKLEEEAAELTEQVGELMAPGKMLSDSVLEKVKAAHKAGIALSTASSEPRAAELSTTQP